MVKWRVARDLRCALREKEKEKDIAKRRAWKLRTSATTCNAALRCHRHYSDRQGRLRSVYRREKENVGARRRQNGGGRERERRERERERERDMKGRREEERAAEKGEKEKKGNTHRREREELGRTFLAREFPSLYLAPATRERSTRRIRASRSGLERP